MNNKFQLIFLNNSKTFLSRMFKNALLTFTTFNEFPELSCIDDKLTEPSESLEFFTPTLFPRFPGNSGNFRFPELTPYPPNPNSGRDVE